MRLHELTAHIVTLIDPTHTQVLGGIWYVLDMPNEGPRQSIPCAARLAVDREIQRSSGRGVAVASIAHGLRAPPWRQVCVDLLALFLGQWP